MEVTESDNGGVDRMVSMNKMDILLGCAINQTRTLLELALNRLDISVEDLIEEARQLPDGGWTALPMGRS